VIIRFSREVDIRDSNKRLYALRAVREASE
jgi:hypothetical protein